MGYLTFSFAKAIVGKDGDIYNHLEDAVFMGLAARVRICFLSTYSELVCRDPSCVRFTTCHGPLDLFA